jgi:hypothetical protein
VKMPYAGGLLLIASLAVSSPDSAPQIQEKLVIYDMSTQNGTVVLRTFTDSGGRTVKEIYYTAAGFRGPYTEDMLRPTSVRLYRYDDQGRKIRVEHRGPDMNLSGFWETVYQGRDKAETMYAADGIRKYEIRYRGNMSVSHLYYDSLGKDLVGGQGCDPAG